MISFDVSNLFTSVPNTETLPFVSEALILAQVDANSITCILTLLNFCLSQDFFVFNDKLYKQPDRLAMDSCLSPFLADIFMTNLENKLIITANNPEILHWFRYVDDCLVFVDGYIGIVNNLLAKINQVHPSIKFTLELESNNKLNFLDFTIHKINNLLNFRIFRKPTQTDHNILSLSSHPHQHKMAAFNCYIHRLLNGPLFAVDYQNKFNIIKQIASNNSYNPNIINSFIQKIKNKKELNAAYPKIDSIAHFVSLPFLNDNIPNKISGCITSNIDNIKISFKTNHNLNRYLVNTKDKVDKLSKRGIYRLNCDAAYIGRTCRPLKVRITEHSKPNKISAIGQHLRFNNHNFSPNRNSKILQEVSSKSYNRLDFLEDLHINRELLNNDLCLNTQVN